MEYIVYKTTNLVNNKIYIGVHKAKGEDKFGGYYSCGVNINFPASYKNPKTLFQKAIVEYGFDNFKREILYVFNTAEEAYSKEKELVNIDFINLDTNYNMVVGGCGGNVSREVYQYTLNGDLIQKWDSVINLAETYGTTVNSPYTALQFRESFRDTFLSYDNTIDVALFSKCNNPKPTYQYNKNGKLIAVYDSLSAAGRANNLNESIINTAIKYQQLRGGYYFTNKLVDTFKKVKGTRLTGSKFYLYNNLGEFVQEFACANDLQEYFGLKSWAVLSKKIHYNNGFYKNFRILTEYVDNIEPFEYKQQSKPVLVYDKQGNFIGEYKSESSAAKELNCRKSGINRVLRGVAYSHNNYIFKWKS